MTKISLFNFITYFSLRADFLWIVQRFRVDKSVCKFMSRQTLHESTCRHHENPNLHKTRTCHLSNLCLVENFGWHFWKTFSDFLSKKYFLLKYQSICKTFVYANRVFSQHRPNWNWATCDDRLKVHDQRCGPLILSFIMG